MFASGSAQYALGRPQERLAAAAPVRAAGCRGLHVRRAWRSLFFVFTLLHACRPSGQPSFSACFSAFPDGDSKVCVCVCANFAFLELVIFHILFDENALEFHGTLRMFQPKLRRMF